MLATWTTWTYLPLINRRPPLFCARSARLLVASFAFFVILLLCCLTVVFSLRFDEAREKVARTGCSEI